MVARRMHMKANHLAIAVTILTVGSLGFAQDQVEAAPPEADAQVQEAAPVQEVAPVQEAAPVEAQAATEAAPAKIPAILTQVIEAKKLSGKEEEVTVAPLAAVFTDDGKYFVLAKGAESDVDFSQLEVEVGNTDGQIVEIKAGLAPGDEVIVVSLDQLKFPTFGDGKAGAACGPAGCPTNGVTTTGAACPTDGTCNLSIPAGEFFTEVFDEGYGPGPGHGPVFYGGGGGPGFGPGPGY